MGGVRWLGKLLLLLHCYKKIIVWLKNPVSPNPNNFWIFLTKIFTSNFTRLLTTKKLNYLKSWMHYAKQDNILSKQFPPPRPCAVFQLNIFSSSPHRIHFRRVLSRSRFSAQQQVNKIMILTFCSSCCCGEWCQCRVQKQHSNRLLILLLHVRVWVLAI